MGDVVGSTVWIKLKNGQVVCGVLQSIVAGSHLTLQNVYFPSSGTRWQTWTLQATAIEDLEVTQTSAIPPPQQPPPPPRIQPEFAQAPIPQNAYRQAPPPVAELPEAPPTKAAFVDPAIVSYGSASPVQQKRRPSKPSELETPVKAMLAKAAANLPSPGSPFIADLVKANVAQKLSAAATGSALPGAVPIVAEDIVSQENGAKKKVRRGQKAKKQTAGNPASEFANPPPVMNSEVSRNGNDMNGAVKRGKGWRMQHEQIGEPHFAIATSMTPCPTLLPRALEALETAAVSAFGITYDSVTENAARCIAEAALQLSDLHGNMRRPSRTNTLRGSMTCNTALPSPTEGATVVVLAGNHDIGARALAAARQLLGRGVNIIAVESLFETADSQDPQMKTQSAILRRMTRRDGSVSKLKRGRWSKSYRHIKNLTGPPAVIIDALLAGATYESLLAPNAEFSANAQRETREMIDWANRSRAPVLSIGCPSGLSGVDGISTIVEGEPLSIRPDRILALGAPYQGLLKAVENGELDKVNISVADIGINIALKSDEAVAFGTSWVPDLQYQPVV
ncbi:uncharacterized protein MYCFIDRAFT_83405 [Pseudocercospora fijiensis CIRAD86]|uniref:YjeF N-terminal domain-containing protein n=1 Tax=Pseudocercospora fijiensis (strain CIRAD86) TaxID=383855 RepID=M3A2C2_PSEFD|nr:uncharacterized protein MYCFIDRAFT_83405 [Pseudocercospora fijiensis CIRAD86]EME85324.1 hypothetical protein MYCFIDRAFT_83405 [Pseudocercospora fijiensis CIRAD86]